MEYRTNAPESPKPKEPSDMYKLYKAIVTEPGEAFLAILFTVVLVTIVSVFAYVCYGFASNKTGDVKFCTLEYSDGYQALTGHVDFYSDKTIQKEMCDITSVSSGKQSSTVTSCAKATETLLETAAKVCPGGKVGK